MAENLGKKFEDKFKENFLESIPNSTIDRLKDNLSGFYAITNISDFIGYAKPNIFYLECKSHRGNTFNWANLRQYDDLLTKVGIPGVRTGVVLWMIDHDIVVYLPIATVRKMKQDGHKSFHVKMLKEDKYKIIQIPSVKLRKFMNSDYSILMTLEDGD